MAKWIQFFSTMSVNSVEMILDKWVTNGQHANGVTYKTLHEFEGQIAHIGCKTDVYTGHECLCLLNFNDFITHKSTAYSG